MYSTKTTTTQAAASNQGPTTPTAEKVITLDQAVRNLLKDNCPNAANFIHDTCKVGGYGRILYVSTVTTLTERKYIPLRCAGKIECDFETFQKQNIN
jgi:hypothetical protein